MSKVLGGVTYFTLGEMAEQLGISKQTIKRWEILGKISPARRHKNNNWRLFSEAQVKEIEALNNITESPALDSKNQSITIAEEAGRKC